MNLRFASKVLSFQKPLVRFLFGCSCLTQWKEGCSRSGGSYLTQCAFAQKYVFLNLTCTNFQCGFFSRFVNIMFIDLTSWWLLDLYLYWNNNTACVNQSARTQTTTRPFILTVVANTETKYLFSQVDQVTFVAKQKLMIDYLWS